MARTARRVPVLGAIRPNCVVRWNNQAQCQEARVHTGEWRQSSTRETSSLRSADYNGCAHPTGHLYTLDSLRTAARIFIILYTGQFYGKASSHFKVSFRLGNFNDHFVGKPTSVLRARAFVTLLRTCAVPNKLRIRTQFRKIKPHFILFTFRVPKMEIRGPIHLQNARLIESLHTALSHACNLQSLSPCSAASQTVTKCPPASKQASHLLKIFSDTIRSSYLEI